MENGNKPPSSPNNNVPKIGKGPTPSFFKALAPAPSRMPPRRDVSTITMEDLVKELQAYGKGWDDELEKLLDIPKDKNIFKIEVNTTVIYCLDDKTGIGTVVEDIDTGKIRKPLPDYAICLDGPSVSAVYFILTDMRRRIIVKDQIHATYEAEPKKDWSRIKDKIKSASSAVSTAKEGMVAVYSETALKLLKIED